MILLSVSVSEKKRLIQPVIILKEFTLAQQQENEDQFHKQQGQGLFSQEMTNKIETQFKCRPAELQGRTAKTAQIWNCNSLIFGLVCTPFRYAIESYVADREMVDCNVMDQGSGDGRFFRSI